MRKFLMGLMVITFCVISNAYGETLEGYFNSGVKYFKSGQYKEAIENFSKVIEIDPNRSSAYFNRAVAYYKSKSNPQLQIADFTKAIELDKYDHEKARAYDNRAISYYDMKEYQKALEDVTKAEKLGMRPDVKFHQKLDKALSGKNQTIFLQTFN